VGAGKAPDGVMHVPTPGAAEVAASGAQPTASLTATAPAEHIERIACVFGSRSKAPLLPLPCARWLQRFHGWGCVAAFEPK